MKRKEASMWQLYLTFLKIGGLTFGGGYAMLPMLQREVIDIHHWVTEEEVLDIYAIGQCSPGIIAVNTATMIGYRKRGISGAIAATLGEVTPSLVLITMLATILLQIQDNIWVQRAFGGIRVAVCALITQSVFTLSKKSLIDVPTVLLYVATVAATLAFSLSPLMVIPAAILYGLVVQRLKRRKP
ncbi:chromate transporter [Sphaerochaeta halotolerans]|jgi:chromate transporter|uniref:chromate transporter n=1 Tax=Sphaerochaeta halotolerans TaxID=2293840 RepID=UPI00136C0797|nr:chromate transporter [Sphaerochaeta halotolerans]MXI85842.1 chromate transporter [Sphaerochaeta halotolerans]